MIALEGVKPETPGRLALSPFEHLRADALPVEAHANIELSNGLARCRKEADEFFSTYREANDIVWKYLVQEVLPLPFERIRVSYADTGLETRAPHRNEFVEPCGSIINKSCVLADGHFRLTAL